MKEDKVFQYCLLASFIVHIIVLVQISSTRSAFKHKPLDQLEVVYHVRQPEKKEEPRASKKKKSVQSKKSQQQKSTQVLFKEQSFPSHLVKDVAKIFSKIKSPKRKAGPLPSIEVKRKISVPMLKSEKITNAKYLSYHHKIRQRISEKAYLYVNDPAFEAGEVYLTFALLSNGHLKEIKIIEAKTSANQFLRNVGLRSIKESAPFPPFPKNLNYPELSFNVVISFEINE